MAVEVNKDECIGCSACAGACPFGAIVMEDDKAVITEACTVCGACVDTCPVGAITNKVEKKEIAINKDDYKGVWVYIEQVDGKARNVGYELLNEGRKLADAMKQELAAVIIGDHVDHLTKEAIARGANKVYLVEGSEFKHYSTDGYTITFADLINTYKPSVLLMGATNDGRDLGPRVSCRVTTGLTADCTNLGIDEATGLVAWTRPAFGGNIMATILCPDHRPQMGTVRPNVFKRAEPDYTLTGEVIKVASKVKAGDIRTKLIEIIKEESITCNLEEAEVIVSGGRGMGKPENFALIQELASVLGGAVGSSRAAVDAGWMTALHQVGQSGKTVGPKVYVACGISGAIQHVAGMSSSDVVIAINKDPEATIFKIANYGIVGDVMEVIPALIEEIKKVKAVG